MTRQEIQQAFSDLRPLVKKMDVPSFRQESIPWLSKNLGDRNSAHPDYSRAMEIIDRLLRAGVHKPH